VNEGRLPSIEPWDPGPIGPLQHAKRNLLDSNRIVAIYGSPRRRGNTATLLKQAVAGARDAGTQVEEIVLRDLKLSPCLEIYSCRQDGECCIHDDFQRVRTLVLSSAGLMLASPIFYYTVSAHTKVLMDRFHSLWVKKYLVNQGRGPAPPARRKGLFISAGATRGKRLFEGTLLSMRYFFDTLDMDLWRSLLCRGLEDQGEAQEHPDYMDQAYVAGRELAEALKADARTPASADEHGR
jgi:multimeric flavodoxin WrbA